jgi:hypothetical protein
MRCANHFFALAQHDNCGQPAKGGQPAFLEKKEFRQFTLRLTGNVPNKSGFDRSGGKSRYDTTHSADWPENGPPSPGSLTRAFNPIEAAFTRRH